MPSRTTIHARAAAVTGAAVNRRGSARARAALAVSVVAAAAVGTVLAGAGPAAAYPVVTLYAAPAAAGTGDCSTTANACTLTTALTDVQPGGTIDLITPGATVHYVGNWTVNTPGTTATAPVTIEAAPGLASQPVLDGNHGNSTGCSTTSCDGPVLTVPIVTGGTTEYVVLSGITIADANNTTTDYGGGLDNAGSVIITGSTFTGNTADYTFNNSGSGDGGAIDNGDGINGGWPLGSVTVTGSTFTGNTASNDGGAIDSGDYKGGGSVTVAASTFTGNTATATGSAADGGAIDSGDDGGKGTMTVTASTFTGNTATTDGNTIDSGDTSGGGTVQLAGDLFDGSCDQVGGAWADGGYNAGTDKTCFNSSPPASDMSGAAVHSDLQTTPTGNGGPTQTIAPTTGNPAIGLIKNPPVTVTLGSNQMALCPAVDQRGYATAAGTACDAGAVQTSGSPPALTLKDSARPASFNQAGQVISYSDTVTNTGAGTLSGITVTDPAVPGVSCPAASLAAGASETCTGSYTTTSADLAAGKITDTAAAAGATTDGVPVASSAATVTVPEGWPPALTGTRRPVAGAAEGYYLGVKGNTWQLLVTHPGTASVSFAGRISVPAGTLGHLTLINPVTGQQVTSGRRAIAFTLPDSGTVTGFSFTTTAKVTKITLTLDIGGQPAAASQIYQGNTRTRPAGGSPLTYTR